jgi:Na+/melibiose symporter-like transporter
MVLVCAIDMSKAMLTVQKFAFFKSIFGTSNFICGLSVAFSVIFEIPLLFYSEEMLNRIGPNWLLALSSIIYFFRLYGLTLVSGDSMIIILLFETLHGVSYALNTTAESAFAVDISAADKNYYGLAKTLSYFSFIKSCCRILSNTIAGYLEDVFGHVFLFQIYSSLLVISIVQFLVVFNLHSLTSKSKSD